jgi:hypothetical protein
MVPLSPSRRAPLLRNASGPIVVVLCRPPEANCLTRSSSLARAMEAGRECVAGGLSPGGLRFAVWHLGFGLLE